MIKYFFATIVALCFLAGCTSKEISDALNAANKIANGTSTGTGSLTQNEAAGGIKDALVQGVTKGVNIVSKPDGFFKNAAIKLLMPPEAVQVEQKLRALGMGKIVDDAILQMNRAAEDAATSAVPIFKSAITSLTLTDALNILKGSNDAATNYLKGATTGQLKSTFMPIVNNSLKKVNATKYWDDVFTTYNKIPTVKPVNPNLSDWVTSKAIDGIFMKVKEEEAQIRSNPALRVTELMKKAFGWSQTHK